MSMSWIGGEAVKYYNEKKSLGLQQKGEKGRTLLFSCAYVWTIHRLLFSGELWAGTKCKQY